MPTTCGLGVSSRGPGGTGTYQYNLQDHATPGSVVLNDALVDAQSPGAKQHHHQDPKGLEQRMTSWKYMQALSGHLFI